MTANITSIDATKAKLSNYAATTNAISKDNIGSSAIDFQAAKTDTGRMSDTVTRYEIDAKLEAIETRMDAKIDRIVESNARIEAGISSMKNTTIVTGVSAVLAIVFGVAAFNATLLSNMTASFESGKSTASAISEASSSLKQTQDELKAIRERLDQQAKFKQ